MMDSLQLEVDKLENAVRWNIKFLWYIYLFVRRVVATRGPQGNLISGTSIEAGQKRTGVRKATAASDAAKKNIVKMTQNKQTEGKERNSGSNRRFRKPKVIGS